MYLVGVISLGSMANAKELPTPQELEKARSRVRMIFADEYKKGDSDLASKLIKKTSEVGASDVASAALLFEAMDLATKSRNDAVAEEAISQLTRKFGANRDTLLHKLYVALSKKGIRKERAGELAEKSLKVAERLQKNERFNDALEVTLAARRFGRRDRNKAILEKAQLLRVQLETKSDQFAAFATAKKTLKRNGLDVKANTKAGLYLCLIADDWTAGLKHLANGSGAFVGAAKLDLAEPTDSASQVKLADMWNEIAASKDEWREFENRAIEWYVNALVTAKGLDKIAIQKKLDDLGVGSSPPPSTSAIPRPATNQPSMVEDYEFKSSIASLAAVGNSTVYVADDTDIWQLNIDTKKKRWIGQCDSRVFKLAVNPQDSAVVVCSCWDGTIRVWDAKTGTEKRKIQSDRKASYDISISSSGRYCVAGGRDHQVKVWDLSNGKSVAFLHGHTAWVLGVAFGNDEKTVVSAGWDGTVRHWSLRTKQELKRWVFPGKPNIGDVEISTDDKVVVASSPYGVRTWSTKTGKLISVHPAERKGTSDHQISWRSRVLLEPTLEGSVRIREMPSAKIIGKIGDATTKRVALSADGKTAYLGSNSSPPRIQVWNVGLHSSVK